MARLVSLLTFSTLAVLLASFQTPVAAVSIHHNHARTPNHDALAKRVTKKAKRCKPRPAPSAVPASSAPVQATATPAAPSSQAAPSSSKAASSTKQSSSAKPAPTQSSGNNGGAAPAAGSVYALFPNKKMLGWGDDLNNLDKGWSQLAQRGYNWQPTTNAATSKFGVKWCPMLWGSDSQDVTNFQNNVLNSDVDVDCALGFNEPELPASAKQSNVDPSTAARLWIDNLVALKNKKGTLLGTPAATSDETAAMQWYDSFFNACKDETGDAHCKADFMALHFYDTSTDGFKGFLTRMHDKYGLPIVVTEFGDHSFTGGAQPSQNDVYGFAGTMKAFFDSTSWIAGYAPFGAIVNLPDIGEQNRIMKTDHTPSDLAFVYYN